MATRRAFLGGAAASLAAAAVFPARAAATPQLVAAVRIGTTDGGAAWYDDALTPFALPARGHQPMRLNARDVVITGRRPGPYAAIADAHDVKRPVRLLAPAKDCVFAGHAAVSPDAKLLVTSEFEAATTKGAVIVRDAASGMARTRWEPGGLEPHDLLFAKDGARLIVAMGGLVHDGGVRGPVYNPDGIHSAIVEMDAASGRVLARHGLMTSLASLSIRHMALAPDGETIAFGMQDQELWAARPLMGVLRVGHGIDLLPLPADEPNLFRGYLGSVAIDTGGTFVAATSPRGGALGLWSLADGRWLGALKLADVCGLTPDAEAGTFWATSGEGAVVKLHATPSGPVVIARWHANAQFDNHLLRI